VTAAALHGVHSASSAHLAGLD